MSCSNVLCCLIACVADVEGAIKELRKWIDVDDVKYAELNTSYHTTRSFKGYALKAINKSIDNTPDSSPTKV